MLAGARPGSNSEPGIAMRGRPGWHQDFGASDAALPEMRSRAATGWLTHRNRDPPQRSGGAGIDKGQRYAPKTHGEVPLHRRSLPLRSRRLLLLPSCPASIAPPIKASFSRSSSSGEYCSSTTMRPATGSSSRRPPTDRSTLSVRAQASASIATGTSSCGSAISPSFRKTSNITCDPKIWSFRSRSWQRVFNGQIEAIFTPLSKEDELFRLRSEFLDKSFARFGVALGHLEAEAFDLALSFNPPVVDTRRSGGTSLTRSTKFIWRVSTTRPSTRSSQVST